LSKSLTSRTAPAATIWLSDSRIVADHELDNRLDWLTDDEVARYRRFVRPQRQQQFLLGRVLLRVALGDLLDVEPDTISLSERPGRAPVLHGVDPVPGFSISHSGPWVACAVSADLPLGLDIELLDAERDLVALAEQAFCSEEAKQVAALAGELRVRTFYELWSRKEAAYKFASASVPGAEREAHFSTLSHPEISIVLCSARPLSATTVRYLSHHW
jgi:4'-phosphopantetheinyl transferase